ncbi:MAG: APC family permease, partial [Acidobacteriota bacterium]
GQYLRHVVGAGTLFARLAAVGIMALFVALNLRGVGEAGGVEIVLVWFKLFALVGLAAMGLARWDPQMLSRGVPDSGVVTALFGAASVFMAYEGFQLLAYDYEDIDRPDTTLPRAVLSAVVFVTLVYVVVALGTAMMIGADRIVDNEEVALAIAGQAALGFTGLVLITVAAAFSTGSAINSTLFATARLSHTIAEGGELPASLAHTNAAGAPDRAVIGLGSLAALLAVVGSLSTLVEAASLAFLFTFGVVCGLAFTERVGMRWMTGAGALGAAAATVALMYRLAHTDPWSLAYLAGVVLVVSIARPLILRHVAVESDS